MGVEVEVRVGDSVFQVLVPMFQMLVLALVSVLVC